MWQNQSPALDLQKGGGKGPLFHQVNDNWCQLAVPHVRRNRELQRFGKRPLDQPITDESHLQHMLVVNKILP